jgi:branched-chain amino acid transport system substrate-binding protein
MILHVPPAVAPKVSARPWSWCIAARARTFVGRRGVAALFGGVFLALPLVAPASAADLPPVRIGVLTDMTGPYGDAAGAGSVTAANLAVADFGPTVLGRKIEIISADHQNKPDVGVSIARAWFDTQGVDMVTDLTNSAVAVAVQALATEKHRIDLVTSTATTAITNEACSPTGVHWTFDS